MTKEEYAFYLQSDHWLDVREKRKEIDGYQCVLCGAANNLHVHHISYNRLWNEIVDVDLVTLCEDCHFKLHRALSMSEDLMAKKKEQYSDELYGLISQSQELKDLKTRYVVEVGKIYAQALKEFAGEIQPSKEAKLISIFNEHLRDKSSFGKLVTAYRIRQALFVKGKPDTPYSVACKEFAQIRRQKRKF